ncbi:MAG: alpha-1,2-fucosyltransferase [Dysgonamonadaceae bacterium]|jgi:hypothetical protein|nr:alpha-1,2-fucosyltransferase [Dysgonamonadaceae bacterium]
MIFVTGFGQMCNNILQFGHFYAWGRESGIDVIAMRFCYKYSFFEINKKKTYNWFTYLFAKYGAKMKCFPTVAFDDEQSMVPERMDLLKESKFVMVQGWFMRNYELFLKYRSEITELFQFNKKVCQSVNLLFSHFPETDLTLGVHIRRGDYIRWQEGKYFFQDEDYCSFISSFLELHPEKTVQVLIATNDPRINPETFRSKINVPVHFLSGSAGEDLCALSRCDYLIGPPSTFSLMASFYEDIPLYWVFDKDEKIVSDSFQKFEALFRNII